MPLRPHTSYFTGIGLRRGRGWVQARKGDRTCLRVTAAVTCLQTIPATSSHAQSQTAPLLVEHLGGFGLVHRASSNFMAISPPFSAKHHQTTPPRFLPSPLLRVVGQELGRPAAHLISQLVRRDSEQPVADGW